MNLSTDILHSFHMANPISKACSPCVPAHSRLLAENDILASSLINHADLEKSILFYMLYIKESLTGSH